MPGPRAPVQRSHNHRREPEKSEMASDNAPENLAYRQRDAKDCGRKTIAPQRIAIRGDESGESWDEPIRFGRSARRTVN